LLNPEDGNAVTAFGSDTSPCASSGHTSEDASGSGSDTRAVEATTAVLVVTTKPPPKRRGRKAHLPKMNNSERGKYYRNKRKRYGDELMSSVAAVREEIVRLHAMKAICNDLSISTHMSLPGSFGRIVREFFVQFRHGVQLSPARRNMALPDVEISTCQQELYMNATMARDVDFGEFQGIDTIMDQWQRYSQYHSLLVFEMLDMHITGPKSAPIVSANGRLRARYSRKTIENVFPHVVGNEPLIQRLIGKSLEGQVQIADATWRRLNLLWAAFYALLGGANLFVVFNYSEATWVKFKVIGITAATFVFLAAQMVWIMRKQPPETPTPSA
jgi:hypothetical protein